MGYTLLTIIGRSDSLGVLLPQIIRRWRGPRTVVGAFFCCPPVRTGRTSPLEGWRATPSPPVSIIPVVSVPIPIPVSFPFPFPVPVPISVPVPVPVPVIDAFPFAFATATRAARPVTRPIGGRWGPPIPVVAPNRGRRIFGPLERCQLGALQIGVIEEITNLDAQAMSIEVPSVPGCHDELPQRW